jgi:hypothetical protein
LLTEIKQHAGKVDPDRAHLETSAAQRRGIWEIAKLLESKEGGREHGSDGPGIHRPVAAPTGVSIDRADIDTGAAANAAEHLLQFGTEQAGPAVVEDDNVECVGAVGFSGPARTSDDVGVDA